MQQSQRLLQNPIFITVGLFVITFLCFVPSLQNDWVNWDDPTYVLNNPLIVSDSIQWSAIWKQEQVLGIYHPLTLLSYAFDYQIWGTDPYGFHLTNIVFHALNTCLVFFVFRNLRTSLLISTIIALLFGIHPMHVESVTWISERKDVLYVFFLLLSWISYLLYRSADVHRKWGWYGLLLVLFACSILSKPIAFVFPVILILSDYLLDGRFILKSIVQKTPVILMALVALFIAQSGQVDSQSLSSVSEHPVPTIFYGSYNVLVYLFKSFIPMHLSVFHPFPLDDSMNTLLYLSAIPFVALLWLLYWSFRKEKRIFFGLAFFLLTIAPLLQIIPFGKALTSERYTYLPYLGIFFVIGSLIERILNKNLQKGKLIFGGIATCVIIFTAISIRQQLVWKNGNTLWTSAIESNPDAYFPYLSRGRYFVQSGQTNAAWNDFQKSVKLHPNPEAFYEIGLIQEARGETKAALESYLKATKSKIPYAKAHMNVATLYGKLGNRNQARFHIEKALQIDPDYSLARYNLAILLKIEGKLELASVQINKALDLEPKNMKYLEMRAAIYTDLSKHRKAIRDFKQVIRENPKNAVATYYLGLNYLQIGDTVAAKKELLKAAKLNYPLPAEIIETLGITISKP